MIRFLQETQTFGRWCRETHVRCQGKRWTLKFPFPVRDNIATPPFRCWPGRSYAFVGRVLLMLAMLHAFHCGRYGLVLGWTREDVGWVFTVRCTIAVQCNRLRNHIRPEHLGRAILGSI